MKVFHIIERLSDFGGTPRKLLYLNRFLDSAECEQIFFCYLPSDLKEEFERYGAVVECLSGSSLLDITRNAISLIRKHKPNIIYTHFSRPLVAGYLAALANGLPMVHNEHSSAHYRRGVGRFFAKVILPRVQAVTCNSNYTLRSVSEVFSVPTEKMTVLYNPVVCRKSESTRTDMRREFGFFDNSLVIGHVGGMIPQRDQETLISAFAKVRARHVGARLLVIGDGPKRAELESSARTLRLSDSVTFVGYTDRIGDYLQAMDIYVNPTLDEGFGIAVVEAMLAGLPVILSNKGAHPELIHDGASGLLYPGGDVDVLSTAIERLAASAELRSHLGKAGRDRAATHFSPEQYAKAFWAHAIKTVEMFSVSAPAYRRKGWRWNALF